MLVAMLLSREEVHWTVRRYLQKMVCKPQVVIQPRKIQEQYCIVYRALESKRDEQYSECQLENSKNDKSVHPRIETMFTLSLHKI